MDNLKQIRLQQRFPNFEKSAEDIDHIIKEIYFPILNEEKPLPCFFDLVNYDSLPDNKLKKHIDSHGRLIIKH